MVTTNGKASILFVDDEVNILQSIRRWALFSGGKWDVRFAESGAQALVALESAPVDIVVSDMRMPEMNGSELLSRVRDRWPDTVRIIMSGQSDKDLVLNAFAVTHQFLFKPIDMVALKNRLDGIIKYRALLMDKTLRALTSNLSRMPVMNSSLEAFARVASGNGDCLGDVTAVVENDVFLAAKLSHLAYFLFSGDSRQLLSVKQLVANLGVEAIRSLIGERFFTAYAAGDPRARFMAAVSEHCIAVGRLAGEIALAKTGDEELAAQAVLAGFFHDIGMTMFLKDLPDCEPALTLEAIEGFPHHDKIGAYLLAIWGMNDVVKEAVAFHHEPRQASSGEAALVTAAVHVADALLSRDGGRWNLEALDSLGWGGTREVWQRDFAGLEE